MEPRFDAADWYRRGNELADAGLLEEARAAYREATGLDALQSATWFNLAWTSYEVGDFEGAASAYRHSTDLDTSDSDAWIGLAEALNALRRYREAQSAALHAIEVDADRPEAWRILGEVQANDGRNEAALDSYARVLLIDPTAETWRRYGTLLGRCGRAGEAVAAMRRATSSDLA
jgi:tetratricopeptide (TPR) repeat protein